jgi:hypothetical protein
MKGEILSLPLALANGLQTMKDIKLPVFIIAVGFSQRITNK